MTLTHNSHNLDVLRAGPTDWQCACVSLVTGIHMDTVAKAFKHLITRHRETRGKVDGIWHGNPEERDTASTKFVLVKIFEEGYRIKITHYGAQ